jgi:hypothetical protein
LREQFVIDEGEGKPIELLLGMAVSQDLAVGTVHMHGACYCKVSFGNIDV